MEKFDSKSMPDGYKFEVIEGNNEFKVSNYGERHKQTLILFFGFAIAYTLRACMGVALVEMIADLQSDFNMDNLTQLETSRLVFREHIEIENKSNVVNITVDNIAELQDKPHGLLHALLLVPPYPKFKWSKKIQDIVQSSFFWGYMILQIPGGMLAHRFGCRRLLTGAMAINCVIAICLPWAAYYGGWIVTLIFRLIQGLSQACIIPGMHTFFGKWAPLEERSRLAGFAAGGQAIGTVMSLPITGFLAASPLGWPGVFRCFGILNGIIGTIIYFKLADTPSLHPKISVGERRYIEEKLGQTNTTGKVKSHSPVPWKHILLSKGMIAICAGHIGQTWGQVTLFSQVPSFMQNIMGVNIKANGLLTALPFLVMWFANFFHNWFTDMLIVKKILSVTNARKLANSIGSIPPCIGLIALSFAPKDIFTVEAILCVICICKISSHVGCMVNHIDISPNFAGTMISISNFCSNFVGSQAPLVAGFILTDVTDEYQWRKVFFVAAGLYFVTNFIYVVLGTAEKAEWNDLPEEKKEETEKGVDTKPMLPKAPNGV